MGSFCPESGARLIMKTSANDPKPDLNASNCVEENQYFAEILPILLSTVAQQFLHMLILRRQGQPAMVARIKEVDDADFVSAMRVIDLLISREVLFAIPWHTIDPGACVASIIDAERFSERILETRLGDVSVVKTDEGRQIVRRLKEPRERYRHWLAYYENHPRQEEDESGTRKTVRALVSECLALMEQALLDAFVFWARDSKEAANNSWRISGAAMLYITALSKFCGSVRDGDTISISPSQPRIDTDQDKTEQLLISRCLKMAHSAAYCCPDQIVAKLFIEIARDCEKLARLRTDDAIQLGLGYSDIFCDFQNARNRMHP